MRPSELLAKCRIARTELDHRPPQKQREVERMEQMIFEEFKDAFAIAKHEWKKWATGSN